MSNQRAQIWKSFEELNYPTPTGPLLQAKSKTRSNTRTLRLNCLSDLAKEVKSLWPLIS